MPSIAPDTVFTRTTKGILQAQGSAPLSPDQRLVLSLVDGKTSASEIQKRSGLTPEALAAALQALASDGAIRNIVSDADDLPQVLPPADLDFTSANPEGHAALDLADRVRKLNERVRIAQATRGAQAEEHYAESAADTDDWPALQLNEGGASAPAPASARSPPPPLPAETYSPAAREGEHVPTALERTMAAMARTRTEQPGANAAADEETQQKAQPEPRLEPLNALPPLPQFPTKSPAAEETTVKAAPENEPTIDKAEPSAERLNVDRTAHDLIAESAETRRRDEAARLNRDALAIRARRTEEKAKREATALSARRRHKFLIATGLVGIVVFTGTIAGLQFVPLNEYVPDAQRALSQRLAQPVTVGTVRYVLFPSPRLILEDVAIGANGSVRVERLSSPMGPLAAFNGAREFDTVQAHGVVVEPGALAAIPSWTGGRTAGTVHARLLQLSEVTFRDVPLEPFGGDVVFQPNGTIRTARLASPKATLELEPTRDGVRVTLEALDWRIPYGPPVEFGRLNVRGLIDPARLAAAEFTGRIGGGALEGALTARWNGPVSIQGEFKTDGVRLQELYTRSEGDYGVRGTANVTGRFSLQGATWKTLTADPQVTASFAAARGEFTNLDLMRALQNPTQNMRGGRTPYDTLTGIVQSSGNALTFRQLQLTSGPLNAAGSVNVRTGGRLDGRLVAEVAGRGGRTALAVGGTATEPALRR